MPARDAVPTSVPMVSNMSIMQKVIIRLMAVNQPMLKKSAKSNLNSVVSTMSWKGGRKDAPSREAKGLVPRKIKQPAQ